MARGQVTPCEMRCLQTALTRFTSFDSNYDFGCHTVPLFCNGSTPDVTVNEYYQYKQDIQRVKAMGVNSYSFSISWPRILPFGNKESPTSEAGLKFVSLTSSELSDLYLCFDTY